LVGFRKPWIRQVLPFYRRTFNNVSHTHTTQYLCQDTQTGMSRIKIPATFLIT
jgi:hypothetical protein